MILLLLSGPRKLALGGESALEGPVHFQAPGRDTELVPLGLVLWEPEWG